MPKRNLYLRSNKVLELVNSFEEAKTADEKTAAEEAIIKNVTRVTLFVNGDDIIYVRPEVFETWKRPLESLSDNDKIVKKYEQCEDSKYKWIVTWKEALCTYADVKSGEVKKSFIKGMTKDGCVYVFDEKSAKIGDGYFDFFVTKDEQSKIASLNANDFENKAVWLGILWCLLKDIDHKKFLSLNKKEKEALYAIYGAVGAPLVP